MNLAHLTDHALHLQTEKSAANERLATTVLLHHLAEVMRRRLYAQYSCSSLFDYCVRHLKMSEPQAARRVNAARLLSDCPEVEAKIATGTLTLTAASQVQTFIRNEARAGNAISKTSKIELVKKLESKPTREVERILLLQATRPHVITRESLRAISESISELTVAIDKDTLENLMRLKEIWSHDLGNGGFSAVIKKLSALARHEHDPILKAERMEVKKEKAKLAKSKLVVATSASPLSEHASAHPVHLSTTQEVTKSEFDFARSVAEPVLQSHARATAESNLSGAPPTGQFVDHPNTTPAPELASHAIRDDTCQAPYSEISSTQLSRFKSPSKRSRYVPEDVKRQVWLRDRGKCTYVDPLTRTICGARQFLQLDHTQPFARGGPHTLANLRLRCFAHNQLHASECFG